MDQVRSRHTSFVAAAAVFLQLSPQVLKAQTSDESRQEFVRFAEKFLHPVIHGDVNASTSDLRPLGEMIGDARIVVLSEAVHAAAEPLEFRNRLFKYLVETRGFNAIAIESGLVESQVAYEYVIDGKGDLETAAKQGLTWTFDAFPQNWDLLRWMRQHNVRAAAADKVRFFGFDVAGSPGNISASRGPDSAIETALVYLRTVDADTAVLFESRIKPLLPRLKSSSYGDFSQAERDALTGAISDLVSLFDHRRLDFIDKSSADAFEWARQAAIGARQVDAWWRRAPLGWKVADGFVWTIAAGRTRDRAMADNLEWIDDRLGSNAKILVFAAASHSATTRMDSADTLEHHSIPFGLHAKARFGEDLVSILNVIGGGQIKFCSVTNAKPITLKPPPASAVEHLFTAVNIPRYVLDLRQAPSSLQGWMQQQVGHWDGGGSRRYPLRAFDIVYYVSPVTSACGTVPPAASGL